MENYGNFIMTIRSGMLTISSNKSIIVENETIQCNS